MDKQEQLNYTDTVILIDALRKEINKKESPGTYKIDLLLKLERNRLVLKNERSADEVENRG